MTEKLFISAVIISVLPNVLEKPRGIFVIYLMSACHIQNEIILSLQWNIKLCLLLSQYILEYTQKTQIISTLIKKIFLYNLCALTLDTRVNLIEDSVFIGNVQWFQTKKKM